MVLATTLAPTLGAVICCAAISVASAFLGLALVLARNPARSSSSTVVRSAVIAGVVLSALAALMASFTRDAVHEQLIGLVAVVCVILSALGGGPVTTAILAFVSRAHQTPTMPAPRDDDAASLTGTVTASQPILPGGAWIGFFERLTTTVCLLLGWPEAIAMTLAIKGVGRYPEIAKSNHGPVVAERFLLGTFVSILWAAGCAGVAVMLR